MRVAVVLTKPPLSSAHAAEAVRLALMFSAMGDEVSLVLMDDGVLWLLERSWGQFGEVTMKNLESGGIRILYHQDASGIVEGLPEIYRAASAEEIASLLLESRAVVF